MDTSLWLRSFYFAARISTRSEMMGPRSTLLLAETTLRRLTYLSIAAARPPVKSALAIEVLSTVFLWRQAIKFMTTKLSPTEIYKDRRIFLIGSTGFLGKVTLSMLLHRFPNVGRVYVTVRARSQEESETRFWNNVITAPPFDPLRERYGTAMDGFIRDKVVVVGGDIAEDNLGFSDEEAQRIADDLDIIINSAGNVTFNPTLESGLRTNVVGTQNVLAFTKRMKRPCLVHISTCFVAGNRSGAVWENDDVIGYFPRRGELPGVELSVEH